MAYLALTVVSLVVHYTAHEIILNYSNLLKRIVKLFLNIP
jgi:hypothetical protein